MKKILILAVVSIITIPGIFAQSPFPSMEASWKVMQEWRNGPQTSKVLAKFYYGTDTIMISNKIFLELKNHGYAGPFGKPGPYIHYDSTLKKVMYIRDFSDTIPKCLYDFSMAIGDTLRVEDHGSSVNTLQWHVIDTISYDLGTETRDALLVKQDYFGDVFQDIWIEGVGSIHGLFTPMYEPPYNFEFGYQLVCFTDSSTGFQFEPDIFRDSTYSCASRISLPEEQSVPDDPVEIFPNPFLHELNLHNSSLQSMEITISTVHGRFIERLSLAPAARKQINSSEWPAGIYILQIESGKETITRKVLKGSL